MSVNSVSGVGRAALSVPAAAPTDPPRVSEPKQQQPAAQPEVEIDKVTQQPKPPRFPWLSRLARELEPASKQPSPYGSTPLLGEQLDHKV